MCIRDSDRIESLVLRTRQPGDYLSINDKLQKKRLKAVSYTHLQLADGGGTGLAGGAEGEAEWKNPGAGGWFQVCLLYTSRCV